MHVTFTYFWLNTKTMENFLKIMTCSCTLDGLLKPSYLLTRWLTLLRNEWLSDTTNGFWHYDRLSDVRLVQYDQRSHTMSNHLTLRLINWLHDRFSGTRERFSTRLVCRTCDFILLHQNWWPGNEIDVLMFRMIFYSIRFGVTTQRLQFSFIMTGILLLSQTDDTNVRLTTLKDDWWFDHDAAANCREDGGRTHKMTLRQMDDVVTDIPIPVPTPWHCRTSHKLTKTSFQGRYLGTDTVNRRYCEREVNRWTQTDIYCPEIRGRTRLWYYANLTSLLTELNRCHLANRKIKLRFPYTADTFNLFGEQYVDYRYHQLLQGPSVHTYILNYYWFY